MTIFNEIRHLQQPSKGLLLTEDHATIFSKYFVTRLLGEPFANGVEVLFLEHITHAIEPPLHAYLQDDPKSWSLRYCLWLYVNVPTAGVRQLIVESLCTLIEMAKSRSLVVYGLPGYTSDSTTMVHSVWAEKILQKTAGGQKPFLVITGRLHATETPLLFGKSLQTILGIPAIGFVPVVTQQKVALEKLTDSSSLIPETTFPAGEDWQLVYNPRLDISSEESIQLLNSIPPTT